MNQLESDEDKNNELVDLVDLVSAFGDVFFHLGGWAYDEDYKLEDVKEALDNYREIKEKYHGTQQFMIVKLILH